MLYIKLQIALYWTWYDHISSCSDILQTTYWYLLKKTAYYAITDTFVTGDNIFIIFVLETIFKI